MIRHIHTVYLILSMLLLGLASCTTAPPVQAPSETRYLPESSPGIQHVPAVGKAPAQVSSAAPPTSSASVSAAAINLLELARQQAAAGDGELAAATLERAINIEPDNPWLWHRLAVLRMQQKQWSQAVELANRSIALADGNPRLIGGNWLVISLALEGAGNLEAAAKAKKNSDIYLGKE